MGKVKVKQIPEVLSPTGEHIMRIWYDENSMPPKNYIWCKGEDDYYIWNGKQWIPYEFELIKQKDKSCCNKCNCINDEDLSKKFENFKKDLLASVLKIVRNGSDVDIDNIVRVVNNIDNRVTTLENSEVDLDGYATEQWVENKGYLTSHQSLDNYYTKTEIDNKALDRNEFEQLGLQLGFVKMIDLTLAEYNALATKQQNVIYNITDAEAYHYDPTAINDSISALRNRVSGVETSVSTMAPIVNRLDAIDHSQFVTSDDLANFDPIGPSGVVTPEDLEGYATLEDLNRAIGNVIDSAPAALDTLNELSAALNNDANFAATITNALAAKANVADLATVATTGSYNDLTNKPTIPTNVSAFNNDAGYITQSNVIVNQAFPTSWDTEHSMIQLIRDINDDESAVVGKSYFSTVSLTDLPANLMEGELKVEILADEEDLGKVILFTLTSSNVAPYHWEYTSAWGQLNIWRAFVSEDQLATVATSGSYNDLSNKPTIPVVPTNVSAFTNDAGYLDTNEELVISSALNDLNGRITTVEENSYDDTALSGRVTTLETTVNNLSIPTDTSDLTNTAGFITSSAIPTNVSAFTNDSGYLVASDISGKANSADLATVATSGNYSDLTGTPTIPTVPTNVSSFTNDAGYITQTTADGRYEPKFVDLTNENAPEAAAQSHTSDNIVYITEVVQPQQNNGGN